jgi:hypothetical protein
VLNLEIALPTYNRNRWGNLDTLGKITVSAQGTNSIEIYDSLKNQIEELLKQTQAENQLVLDYRQLAKDIDDKQSTLISITSQIQRAKRQLTRLKIFLNRLGIDHNSDQMIIAQEVQEKFRTITAVVEHFDNDFVDDLDCDDDCDDDSDRDF